MLGEALRLFRVFYDMTLAELARTMNVSASHLSEIEHNKRKPTIEMLERYAKAFDTTPSAIMFFSEELSKESPKGRVKAAVRIRLIKFLQAIEKAAGEQKIRN